MNRRTEAEWLKMCKNIKGGSVPLGKRENIYLTGHTLVDRLRRWCDLGQSGIKILDWGCGNGRLPMGLVDDFPHLDYIGIDIICSAIDFCKLAFKPWKDFYKFQHVNVKNLHYWPKGTIQPKDFVLPFDNGLFDVIFANSMFTHVGIPGVADHFMSEAHRTLATDGLLIATWIIKDKPSYDEKMTIYTDDTVISFYLNRFTSIGRIDFPETPYYQTEIAARKI